jgi:hypothetical protein
MAIRWVKPATTVASAVSAVAAGLGGGPPTGLGGLLPISAALRALLEGGLPVHDPPLAPRDEAVFLLHTAAEIEHALLVQYLYAAYSLKSEDQIKADDPERGKHQDQVKKWRQTLLSIAKEEMGHLMTVQNLLLLIGAPLNFEREVMPFKSEFYPFHFRLEPLTKVSLAKYVLAERPEDPEHKFLTEDQEKDLREHAALGIREKGVREAVLAGETPVNRVGALYVKLYCLFASGNETNPWVSCASVRQLLGEPVKHLGDDDFLAADSDIADYQAPKDWDMKRLPRFHILVPPVSNRQEALQAIQAIGVQGEAGGGTGENEPSHFHRFFEIYQDFPEAPGGTGGGTWQPSNPVTENPNTLVAPAGADGKKGNITDAQARGWAELFNLRYRILLNYLAHYLQSPAGSPARTFLDRTTQNRLVVEMGTLTALADQLVAMRQGKKEKPLAGPPFELPFTLSLPVRERDRWRHHLYVHGLAEKTIDDLYPGESPENRVLLDGLRLTQEERLTMQNNANPPVSGGGGPAPGAGGTPQPSAGGTPGAGGAAPPPAAGGTPAAVTWAQVKEILDGAIAAWKAQNGREPKLKQKHSPNFGWDAKQDLAAAVARGHRLIDPAKVGNGQGAQTNLVIALRDDDGVDGNGRMPDGGPYLGNDPINAIIRWIDAGMPD